MNSRIGCGQHEHARVDGRTPLDLVSTWPPPCPPRPSSQTSSATRSRLPTSCKPRPQDATGPQAPPLPALSSRTRSRTRSNACSVRTRSWTLWVGLRESRNVRAWSAFRDSRRARLRLCIVPRPRNACEADAWVHPAVCSISVERVSSFTSPPQFGRHCR